MCINETWLSDSIYDQEILPQGYTIYRRDRSHHGGRVLIAVSNLVSSDIELIDIELLLSPGPPMTICCKYILPQSPECHLANVIQAFNQFLSKNPHMVIVGDLNLPNIDWQSLTAPSPSSSFFCDSLFSLNLLQLVTEPTHIHGNTLDVVITNQPHLVSNLSINNSSCHSKSDHHLITFNFDIQNKKTYPKPKPRKRFIYSKTNLPGILSYLWNININTPISDANHTWSEFKYIVNEACFRYVPSIKVSHSPKWFNSEIQHSINCIHTLKRQIKKSPTAYKLDKLSQMESSLQQLMESRKQRFECNLIRSSHSQPKRLFSYLRYLHSNNSIPLTIFDRSSQISSRTAKVEAYKIFFNSVLPEVTSFFHQ